MSSSTDKQSHQGARARSFGLLRNRALSVDVEQPDGTFIRMTYCTGCDDWHTVVVSFAEEGRRATPISDSEISILASRRGRAQA